MNYTITANIDKEIFYDFFTAEAFMRLTAGCFGKLLATAMLAHRTYGFAFSKGVAT